MSVATIQVLRANKKLLVIDRPPTDRLSSRRLRCASYHANKINRNCARIDLGSVPVGNI